MILGFTGSSQAVTQEQISALKHLYETLPVTELHHGDCIHADAAAHRLACEFPIRIVIHPPNKDKSRAFCIGAHEVRLMKPYLKRNIEIVREGRDGLIALPSFASERLRSGTWSTVRYARKLKRHIWLVFPDGTVREE